jgi:hypothetical protein
MPTTYRSVQVWSGSAWESLAVAFPDLTRYANLGSNNTFTGTNTFSGPVVRTGQIPASIETGTINLVTTTTGDSLLIGTKNFDLNRFTSTPVVMLTVRYPTTVKNGYASTKSISSTGFNYEVIMDLPITDGQVGNGYPLKLDYIAIQMS